jgi:hypothetical protein
MSVPQTLLSTWGTDPISRRLEGIPERNTYNVHTKFNENLSDSRVEMEGVVVGHTDVMIHNYLFPFGK